jgi:hypothetical protein
VRWGALFKAVIAADGALERPFEPGLVGRHPVADLQPRPETLDGMVVRLVSVQKQPARKRGIPIRKPSVGLASEKLGKIEGPLEREVDAPPVGEEVMKWQVEGESVWWRVKARKASDGAPGKPPGIWGIIGAPKPSSGRRLPATWLGNLPSHRCHRRKPGVRAVPVEVLCPHG